MYIKLHVKNSIEFPEFYHINLQVHQETFGKSGCRRIVPGQYLAVDPKGRAIMIGILIKLFFCEAFCLSFVSRLSLTYWSHYFGCVKQVFIASVDLLSRAISTTVVVSVWWILTLTHGQQFSIQSIVGIFREGKSSLSSPLIMDIHTSGISILKSHILMYTFTLWFIPMHLSILCFRP